MLNVCVPVLKRYDLLYELVRSLRTSVLRPDTLFVIDNGQNVEALLAALDVQEAMFPVHVHRPDRPLGVAESWNWFIQNVPEERIITNDDILFAPHSLQALVTSQAPFVSCSFGFSCFLLRDACVARVGLFDETISPGYAYFEDMDYLRRMKMAGVQDEVVLCGVEHRQSATPQAFSPTEWNEHHAKFRLAERNFSKKWNSNPSWDQLASIGGQGAHHD